MQPYAVKLNWTAESDTGDMVVFPKFHQAPFSKILTFYRRDNFAVESEYDGEVPVIDTKIGHFEIGEVRPLADGGNQKVKVKVRINLHGIFVVSSANYVEKHEVSRKKVRKIREIQILVWMKKFAKLNGKCCYYTKIFRYTSVFSKANCTLC